MKNHLPVLEAKEDFGEWGPRSRILARRSTSDSSGAGSRILRVTVYQKLLPMTEIRTADDLMSVMRDIALCHRWLYRVTGILHGDINMNNIMIRRDGAKVVGVLIDYDLAIDINKPSSTSLERIGVRRFMAIDLMKGSLIPHHARHDMEAMHWVLVWFTFRYEDGEEIRATRRPLEKWVTSPLLDDVKNSFLHGIEGRPTPPFSSLFIPWILPWNQLFGRGHDELGIYTAQCKYYAQIKTKEVPNEIDFPTDAVFFHDTSMWTAFWNVLNPDKYVDFDDVCSSARLGFLPYQGHSNL
ncbi:hypothetical protein BS47DRAFT_830653 [Hydnum rufescens UP504]|uniref:Protein kinase domain-containing protein n=1 Tax=Hydnum rufescens UP504 TaxID=1448309 RepID=A0A9P6B086_9AGAM|nr:hypothetical protein BS47DRAFT_830653 [Hydnum rufescens UP504]